MNVQKFLAVAPKRTIGQAFGFYVAYLVLSLLAALIFGLIVGLTAPDNFAAAERGSLLGLVLSLIVSLGLTVAVIVRKGLYRSRREQIITAIFVLLTLGLASESIIVGLLPASLLTLRAGGTPTLYADETLTPQTPPQAI
jgi:uncharacterized membrane protein (UPF0136 family)